jgi:predicted O-methyltransferase YrrM
MPRVRNIMKILNNIFLKLKNHRLQSNYPQLHNAFSVTSHLTMQERVQLMILSANAKIIVEIGSYIGTSACCFGAAVKQSGSGKIVCIDTWNNDAMSEGNRDTWKEFQDNTFNYTSFIVPIRGFSNDIVQEVRDVSPTFDVLFVDGDHSYDGVKADWDAYKDFLKEGATVIFHDYGWAEGVKQVVHEDVLPLVSSNGQLPNMWWGQIGKAL